MADAYSVVADDGTGNKVDESSLTVNSVADVRRQRMVLGDDGTAAALAKVTNAAPLQTDYGLVTRNVDAEAPTWAYDTGDSAMGLSKIHWVLYNLTGSGVVVRVRLVIVKPTTTVATGVLSGAFYMQRRIMTNTPVGASGTVFPMDTANNAIFSASVSLQLQPFTTAPTGTTSGTLGGLFPQPDEIKVSTLDGPTMASLMDFGGTAIYDHSRLRGTQPITIRAGQSLEMTQGTSGTGAVRFQIVWTQETA